MAITASASSTGPRYAPPDPALPKPWRGLVDGKTGYLYFWNPETNVTQYERPIATPLPESSSLSSAKPATTTSSIQSLQSSASSALRQAQHDSKGQDGQYFGRKSPGALDCQDAPGGSGKARHDGGDTYSHGPDKESFVSSARFRGPADAQGGLSAESYRHQHEITVRGPPIFEVCMETYADEFLAERGDDVPAPFMTFQSTGFPQQILREVRYLLLEELMSYAVLLLCCPFYRHDVELHILVHQAGFSAPTPIQAQSWPIALRNHDIVAIAKTGSGKTLGYLIPGFIHLKRCCNKSQMGPTVLILSPTRELATQIQDEAMKFGRSSGISSTCLYGGAPKGPQLRDLERGMDIVVATPGRLNDILQMGRVNLQQVSYLVLDEADRMLDMGFEPQIRKIVKEIPTRRQTLMYTATWPKEVRKIASDLLANPVQVNIGNVDELAANKSITQYVEVITSMEKQRRLEQILRSQQPGSKIIIFCSTKRMCDQLSRTLNHQFGAAAIHGDKSQEERDRVLSQFRAGRSPVLVATDVAARGLDVKDIRVVINYDFPTGVEDYVHRIGRTGRAGATGVAFTFFADQDAKHASDLIKVLEGADQRVPPEIRNMASRSGSGMGRSRRWDSSPGGRDGGGHNGSGYGGRCGREGGNGQNDWQHQDRYASSSGHQGTHGGYDSSRGRSRSPAKSGWGDRGQHRNSSPSFDGNNCNSSADPVRSPSRLWQ